jgi:sugar diacid utilization regulator
MISRRWRFCTHVNCFNVKSSQSPAFEGDRALRRVLATLATAGLIPQAASALRATMKTTGFALREAVTADVPAFQLSGNPDVVPELDAHVAEHISEILRVFGGGDIGAFEFVVTHARRRAEQRFPLDASLRAYRRAEGVLSRWLHDAALATCPAPGKAAISAAANFVTEYINAVSTILTAEYVSHTRAVAEAESDRRVELLNTLLSGYDESDQRAARLLKRAGYLEQRQTYCVVAVQSINPTEMELPQRAQRIENALSAAIAATPIRLLAGIRNNVVIAVLSDFRRQSGWTAPQTKLAERLRPLLLNLGPAVLIGTSTDHPSTSFVPKALQEATIALDFASITNRVVAFCDLPIRSLILHTGGDYVRAAAPGWVAALVAADEKTKGSLILTLRALADADMNVQQAGRELGVHPNTVYLRLTRIKEITGLDGQRHHDLVELLLAADCWKT